MPNNGYIHICCKTTKLVKAKDRECGIIELKFRALVIFLVVVQDVDSAA